MNQEALEKIKHLYSTFQQNTNYIKLRLLEIKKGIEKRKEEVRINDIRNKLDQL